MYFVLRRARGLLKKGFLGVLNELEVDGRSKKYPVHPFQSFSFLRCNNQIAKHFPSTEANDKESAWGSGAGGGEREEKTKNLSHKCGALQPLTYSAAQTPCPDWQEEIVLGLVGEWLLRGWSLSRCWG